MLITRAVGQCGRESVSPAHKKEGALRIVWSLGSESRWCIWRQSPLQRPYNVALCAPYSLLVSPSDLPVGRNGSLHLCEDPLCLAPIVWSIVVLVYNRLLWAWLRCVHPGQREALCGWSLNGGEFTQVRPLCGGQPAATQFCALYLSMRLLRSYIIRHNRPYMFPTLSFFVITLWFWKIASN